MVYGQTEIQKDLADARAASGGRIVWEAKDVAIHDFEGRRPRVTYTQGGEHHERTRRQAGFRPRVRLYENMPRQ